MEINFFYRNRKVGFSIAAVFDTVVSEVSKTYIVKRIFLPSPNANVKSILRNGLFAKKKEEHGIINHITGDVHYLLWFLNKRKTIVTVHDIMYYHYLKGLKRMIWKYLYIIPLKRAAYVTFISHFAYKQVCEVIELRSDRIHIIPNPVDDSFIFSPKVFNAKRPIILHIGTLERKNLNRTIAALNGIECHLRIIGEINNDILIQLKKHNVEYSNAINLSHQEIVEEYRKADIINFPSLFEGFGMPIIEGQATGRVVVTSNLSPMKEVAGEGAVLVDPYSVDDIRNAYHKIIQDASFREVLIKKGRENVSRFSVDIIAEQYMNIYKSMQQ